MLLYVLVVLPLFCSIVNGADYHSNAGVLDHVNPKIGTNGVPPSYIGGMIPSVGTPFGMTRWVAQTRENFQAQCPYFEQDEYIHGFQATHQPAIWMGESGQAVLTPGIGDVVKPLFTQRAHRFEKADELSTPYVYEVTMDANAVEAGFNLTESIYSRVPGGGQPVPAIVSEGANGRTRRDVPQPLPTGMLKASTQVDSEQRNASIKVAMTATSHVGRLLFDWVNNDDGGSLKPYVFIQATRQNWTGHIEIDPDAQEACGSNSQRQDYALGPSRASGFRGYFVSRFSRPFASYGVTQGAGVYANSRSIYGQYVGGYVRFDSDEQVEVRTGVSFVSVEQARRNLDLQTSGSFDETVEEAKAAWLEKLGRVEIEGVNQTSKEYDQKTIFYTAMFHALQYPCDFSEPLDETGINRTFYDGYTDSVHVTNDSYYQSWSIWDTFRAEHSFITLFAPERVNGMMRSLVKIFQLSGWLPMWQNVVETNIMIATHVDAVIANALTHGFKDFDIATAWEGVKKNAFVPPARESELLYYDREPYTPAEVRAGLSTYMSKGWVANDRWSESASRTLDYAFDDYAASIVAEFAGDDLASYLRNRSQNYHMLYNSNTGFMEARNDNGTWAGSDQGWAEGDEWIYTFSVMHDAEGLAALLGGREKMKDKLDAYFNGGHNQQTNEPSHHAPYLYSAIGYPTFSQNLTRTIAFDNYNATSHGLGGGDDLGQMSCWYVFAALGFYPLNPASDEYIIASPFFEKVSIRLPSGVNTGGRGGKEHTLTIVAPGAPTKPFVASLKINGMAILEPVLRQDQIVNARRIEFEMSEEPQEWGSGRVVSRGMSFKSR